MMREKITFGILGVVVGAILALGVVYAGLMFSQGNNGNQSSTAFTSATSTQSAAQATGDCAVKTATATIQGDSMAGILSNGQQVSVLENYYACNDVTRGDIVVYNFPTGPIVKKVMGLPGDTFAIKENGPGWNIVVNGKALVNSSGTPYLLSDQTSKMLALYATSDKGVIPDAGYMILGNVPAGSEDSTQFGLVEKSDFGGKVKI